MTKGLAGLALGPGFDFRFGPWSAVGRAGGKICVTTSGEYLLVLVTVISHLLTYLSYKHSHTSTSFECQEIHLIMLSWLLNSAYQAVQAIDLGH